MAAQVALDLNGLTDCESHGQLLFCPLKNRIFGQLLSLISSARIFQRGTQAAAELLRVRDRWLATESGADHRH
jgi:hypothetical protein